MTNTRSNAKKQRKLTKIMLAPVRILIKASHLYMTCMEDCNGKVESYGGVVFCPISQATSMQKPFASDHDQDEEARRLTRLSSRRRAANELHADIDVPIKEQAEVAHTNAAGWSNDGRGKSYSVGVGKLGKIDENTKCSFDEEDHLSYSKSKTAAVLRRNQIYY